MNAIVHRQQMNEDVGGFFTQIGELYVVHHLWGREIVIDWKKNRSMPFDWYTLIRTS